MRFKHRIDFRPTSARRRRMHRIREAEPLIVAEERPRSQQEGPLYHPQSIDEYADKVREEQIKVETHSRRSDRMAHQLRPAADALRHEPFKSAAHGTQVHTTKPRPIGYDREMEDTLPTREDMLHEIQIQRDLDFVRALPHYNTTKASDILASIRDLAGPAPRDVLQPTQQVYDDLEIIEREIDEELNVLRADDGDRGDTYIQPHFDRSSMAWKYPSLPVLATEEQAERASLLDRMLHVHRLNSVQAFLIVEKTRVRLDAIRRYKSLWDLHLPIPKAVHQHLIKPITADEIGAKRREDDLMARRGRRTAVKKDMTDEEKAIHLNSLPIGLTLEQAELVHPQNIKDDTIWIQEAVYLVRSMMCQNPTWPTKEKIKMVRLTYRVCCYLHQLMVKDKKNNYSRITGGLYNKLEARKANEKDAANVGRFRFSEMHNIDYIQPNVHRHEMPYIPTSPAQKPAEASSR